MKRARPVRAITFDVYGTLIDWESGMWEAAVPLLQKAGIETTRERFLRVWEPIQWELNHGPYKRYRKILEESFRAAAEELGGKIAARDAAGFAATMGRWKPFPDSADGLARLKNLYLLAPITNTDDDFIAASAGLLGHPFRRHFTAQEAKAYKPNVKPFRNALQGLGIPAEEILHVAFGYRYDLGPASEVGMKTAWLNRGSEPLPEGFQADFQFSGMADLVRIATKPC